MARNEIAAARRAARVMEQYFDTDITNAEAAFETLVDNNPDLARRLAREMFPVAVYSNTPENAKLVGWDKVPEYCSGDRSMPWVRHDLTAGTFTFVATVPLDGCC